MFLISSFLIFLIFIWLRALLVNGLKYNSFDVSVKTQYLNLKDCKQL